MEEVAEGKMNDDAGIQHQAEKLPHRPLFLEQQLQISASFHAKDRARKKNVILLHNQPRLKFSGITGTPEAEQIDTPCSLPNPSREICLLSSFAISFCLPLLPRKELQPIKERMTK